MGGINISITTWSSYVLTAVCTYSVGTKLTALYPVVTVAWDSRRIVGGGIVAAAAISLDCRLRKLGW